MTSTQLPPAVIRQDQDLDLRVIDGHKASCQLAALRYEWCEVKGVTQRDYAQQVGVSHAAVRQSIDLHRTRHPDVVGSHLPTGTPKQVAAKQREQAKRSAPEPKRRSQTPNPIVRVKTVENMQTGNDVLVFPVPRTPDASKRVDRYSDAVSALVTFMGKWHLDGAGVESLDYLVEYIDTATECLAAIRKQAISQREDLHNERSSSHVPGTQSRTENQAAGDIGNA